MKNVIEYFNRNLVGLRNSIWYASKSRQAESKLCEVDCTCIVP